MRALTHVDKLGDERQAFRHVRPCHGFPCMQSVEKVTISPAGGCKAITRKLASLQAAFTGLKLKKSSAWR
jgi:hypothetical protein